MEILEHRLVPAGTWTQLSSFGPGGTALLMTDGTVLASDDGAGWYRLTPNASGSYVNGTWTQIASMNDSRLYMGSVVLPDGRLFVTGGEYGSGGGTAEIYEPKSNTWTRTAAPPGYVADANADLLPDGRVLVVGNYSAPMLYNPASNSWAWTSPAIDSFVEQSLAQLPNGNVLTVDSDGTAQMYIPSQDRWVSAGNTPTNMVGPGEEFGAGLLLPDGRAFFLGGNGTTAYYTPGPTVNDPGSWQAGPNLPNGLLADDAPAAVLPNGHVLCEGEVAQFSGPSTYFDFNPATNTYTALPAPYGGATGSTTYVDRMLVLPTGQVLFDDGFVYTPDSGPNPAWQPTVAAVSSNANGSYHLSGTLLNGVSFGAGYGDDATMASNYPLVQLTDGSGNVHYATTFNWAPGEVGNQGTMSTDFSIPTGLPNGTYSLRVVADGIASNPLSFTVGAIDDLTVVTPQTLTVNANASGSGNVLSGAVDSEGDTITAVAGTFTTAHGSVTIATNGTYTYTPNTGYVGSDSFGFTAQTVDDSTSGIVNVTVNAVTVNTIGAAGFESPNVGTGSWGDFQYNPTGTPWTFTGGTGVAGNGSGFTSGNPNAPEGTQVGFLQMTGSISQSVNFAAGSYTLSFAAAQRANSGGAQSFQVLVDGQVIGSYSGLSTAYTTLTTSVFTVAAGNHTITFQGLDPDGADDTAFIDQVSLNATNVNVIGDAGFESPNVGTGSFGAFQYNPTGTAWTFSGGAGVAGNGSGFTSGNPNAPEGTQVGFLQMTGSISQSVNFAAGSYTLGFAAAQRANYGGAQSFQVLIDGQVVGTFSGLSAAYASYTTSVFTVAAGHHTITFQGLDPDGGDDTAFIDQVSLNAATVSAIPTLRDTGVNSSGSGTLADGAADPNWTIIATPAGATNVPAYATDNIWPVGSAWVANSSTSRWISPQADESVGDAPGSYTYRTTFDLTGYDPNSAQLTVKLAVDNDLTDIRLNGVSLGLQTSGYSSFTTFTIKNGFVAGNNTLDFVIFNEGSSTNPSGLRVELSGTAVAQPQSPAGTALVKSTAPRQTAAQSALLEEHANQTTRVVSADANGSQHHAQFVIGNPSDDTAGSEIRTVEARRGPSAYDVSLLQALPDADTAGYLAGHHRPGR
jgi:hypothetical protein